MQDGERPGRYEDDDEDDEDEGGGTATGVLACATIIIALLMLSKIIALKRQVPLLLLVDVSVAIFSFLFDYVCGKDERRTTGGKNWGEKRWNKGVGTIYLVGTWESPPLLGILRTLFEGYSRHVYFTFTRRLRERK